MCSFTICSEEKHCKQYLPNVFPFMLCFIAHEFVKDLNEHVMNEDAWLRFFDDQDEVHLIFKLLSGYINGISLLLISEDINANLVLPLNRLSLRA